MSQFSIALESIVGLTAAISTVLGAAHKVKRLIKDHKEAKELEKQAILQEAKEVAHKYKRELEARIELLERDVEHVKQTYSSEVKFLGTRIEELRDEVRTQLSQIIILVSKLIEKS